MHVVCCHIDVSLECVYVGVEAIIFYLWNVKTCVEFINIYIHHIKIFLMYIFSDGKEELSYKHKRQIFFSSSGSLTCIGHHAIQ